MSIDPQHQIQPESFWFVGKTAGADAYVTMAVARQFGWRSIGLWGSGGWDLGAWPAAIIYHRERHWPDTYELVEWVEGDVTVYGFPTRELRDAVTDRIAFGYWKQRGEPWAQEVSSAEEMPEHLKGPYSGQVSRQDPQVQ